MRIEQLRDECCRGCGYVLQIRDEKGTFRCEFCKEPYELTPDVDKFQEWLTFDE